MRAGGGRIPSGANRGVFELSWSFVLTMLASLGAEVLELARCWQALRHLAQRGALVDEHAGAARRPRRYRPLLGRRRYVAPLAPPRRLQAYSWREQGGILARCAQASGEDVGTAEGGRCSL